MNIQFYNNWRGGLETEFVIYSFRFEIIEGIFHFACGVFGVGFVFCHQP